jgi:hypothetical protein
LADGDDVVFYLAGKGNRVFVGQAELAARPRSVREVPVGRDVGAENDEWNLVVGLRNIDVWPRGVPAEPLVPRLGFIAVKDQWPSRFSMGLISIGKADFETICEAARRAEETTQS